MRELIVINSAVVVRRLVLSCVFLEVAFLILDATINYGQLTDLGMIRRLFNTAREDSLASWFSVTQTFLVGLTLWALYGVSRHRQAPSMTVLGWLLLAIFFTYLAVDDGALVHERIGSAFKKLHEADQAAAGGGESGVLELFPSYTWQILFMPVFATVGVLMLLFLWRELTHMRLRLSVLIALGVMAFAVLLDFFEGLDPSHPWNIYAWIDDHTELDDFTEKVFGEWTYDTLRHFSKSIEECLEMFAMTILWAVFLLHFAETTGELQLRFIGKDR